ncbi:MAG: hypothetical protein ACRCWI_01135 [Brevinema sp.]
MKLNNVYIKKIIADYQSNPSQELLYEFQEHIVCYIKKWPKQKYRCNEDICQDFVLYVLEYIEQILQSFPEQTSVVFTTWFNAVLYYKFCDFVKMGAVTSQNIVLGGDWLDNNYAAIIGGYEQEVGDLIWEGVLNLLPKVEKSLWLFYYMPQQLNSDLLIELTHYTGKSLQDIFLLYQESLQIQYDSYQLQEAYYNKIKQLDHKIAHLENIHRKQGMDFVLEQKILRLKNRQFKYMRSLKIITKKSFKVFIKLFNDYNQAYRMLKKIDLHIKKIIQQSSIKE